MAEKKIWKKTDITCEPLDTLEEVAAFLQDPPVWRSLCKEIIPHSDDVLRNADVNKFFGMNILETPQTFCHCDLQEEDVERHDRKKLPKTLVCHDMANGYHDDCFVDGTGNYDAYSFYNWGAIDIFCYFSHHFVTIPPLGWINVGHAHGVKVLGTVITEWAEGAALWDHILGSESQSQHFISALVAIAKTLKFDGWLLNVENKISRPRELLLFVSTLHSALHAELHEPLLLWYDSVTTDGHLNWQNGLNEKNKAFFDAVDGFFSNYSWCEADVATSAERAAGRVADVFVGIDVWGRNFFGGGQFNTHQAIRLANKYGCSLAIFAQAWTYEAMSDDADDINSVANSDDLDKYERFLLRDRALWCSIWPYIYTKLPKHLPFQTSFCRGQGKKRRLYGEVICPVAWYNLRHMHYQPNSSHGPHGYLLSTQENISGLSRLGLLKSRAGILRYRRSVKDSRINLTERKTSEVAIALKADSFSILNQVETSEANDEGRTPVKKTKMKDAFRNFFRMKPANTGHSEEEGPTAHPETSTTGNAESNAEQSVLDVSVYLRLGEKTEKTRYALAYVPTELECLEPFFEDSFLGGSCLKVNPADDTDSEHRLIRLFHCDFLCKDRLIACVVTKKMVGHENQFLNVKLNLQESGATFKKVVLVGRDIPRGHEEASAAEIVNLYPLCDPSDPDFRDLQEYLLLNEPGFYVSVANAYGWRVRYYEIDAGGARVTSVTVRTGIGEGPILLGHFGLCARPTSATRAGTLRSGQALPADGTWLTWSGTANE